LDVEYAALVRWRLRVPLRAGVCALCGRAFDLYGDHAQSCPRGTRAWNPRHHAVQRCVQQNLRWAGITVTRGQAVAGLAHIPDLMGEAFWIPPTHFEVHVAHPHGHAGAGHLNEWGSSGSAFIDAAWRGRLDRHYAGGPPGDAPYDLVPAAVSSFGAWHPGFVRWVRRLLRDRAAAAASDELEARGLFGGMLWRFAATVSVGAQRAIFQGIARCLPALLAGAGQLGRPLSEEPEFWRAAPDAECVDWVADELGLPAGEWDRPPRDPTAGEHPPGAPLTAPSLGGLGTNRGMAAVPSVAFADGGAGSLSFCGDAASAPGGFAAPEQEEAPVGRGR